MDRHRKGPKPYHTASGEAARLCGVITEYADNPKAVTLAAETLNAHLAAHPELGIGPNPDDAAEDESYQRRCVVGTTNNTPNHYIRLSIYGEDQDATEFLSREQWETFVHDVADVMGWKS